MRSFCDDRKIFEISFPSARLMDGTFVNFFRLKVFKSIHLKSEGLNLGAVSDASAGLFSRRTSGPAAPLFSNGTMAGTPSLTDEDLGYGANRNAREGSFLRTRE